MNQDPNNVQNVEQKQPKEKKVLTLEEQEKSNKKVALVIMMIFCILFVVMGLVGGVVKFIRFVDDMNPQEQVTETTPQEEFYKDGKLLFRNGGSVIAEYKCETPKCGWAFATIDDAQYELKTPEYDGVYELKGIVNNRYAIIYDDASEEPSNIIIYNIQDNKKELELSGIKNYNTDTGNLYIAKNKSGKWGIISLGKEKIEELVSYQFDYIGIVLQSGERFSEQFLYAAKKDDTWSIISTNKSSGSISGDFSNPIVAYNHKLVVTKASKDSNLFNIYTLHGDSEPLEKEVNNYLLPGYNLLVTYINEGSGKKLTVYDAGNAEVLSTKELTSLQNVTYETKDNKIIISADGNAVYDTEASAPTIAVKDDEYIIKVSPSVQSTDNTGNYESNDLGETQTE
jgi:hypothetical protein